MIVDVVMMGWGGYDGVVMMVVVMVGVEVMVGVVVMWGGCDGF